VAGAGLAQERCDRIGQLDHGSANPEAEFANDIMIS
jgi:hypothetical protein